MPFQPGDILLRTSDEKESIVIMSLSEGDYSHAGISAPSTGQAIDAYPGRGRNAIAEGPVSVFFDAKHTSLGVVFRFRGDSATAEYAAGWGSRQCSQIYEFDIRDPVVGVDGLVKEDCRLYCSEFVWRCYRAADVVLVNQRDFFDLFDKATIESRLGNAVRLLRSANKRLFVVPDKVIKQRIRETLAANDHNGFFITPHQLSTSEFVSQVAKFDMTKH